MNHLLAGDTIWLKRFGTHPSRYPALQDTASLPQPTGLTHSFGDTLPRCAPTANSWTP
jgi:hypothetical protein